MIKVREPVQQISAVLLLVSLLTPLSIRAADEPLELKSNKDAYFHVLLEKPNGTDLRWGGKMPPEMLQSLEQQGKSVRPSRTPQFISYWAFMANGDFMSVDMVNSRSPATDDDLSYTALEHMFASAPRDGIHWNWNDGLTVSPHKVQVTQLSADDPVSGGKAGEIVFTVLDSDNKPIYYYVGNFVSATTTTADFVCPKTLDGYKPGEATSAEVLQCIGKPVYEDHNPDGRYVYSYQHGDDLIVTFLFDSSGKLIRISGYTKTKH